MTSPSAENLSTSEIIGSITWTATLLCLFFAFGNSLMQRWDWACGFLWSTLIFGALTYLLLKYKWKIIFDIHMMKRDSK